VQQAVNNGAQRAQFGQYFRIRNIVFPAHPGKIPYGRARGYR